MEYVLLLVGFVLLVKGADFFVEGSSSLAKILKVPSVIIGLTIVAMGTSAPEASVSINAALGGSNDIAISNVVGSNIFNGLVVVGICAFLSGFQTNAEILKRDMPVNILVTLILCLMFLDGTLGRVEGFLLLAGMVLYITCMIRSALRNREEGEVCKVLPLPKSILFMGGGLAAVIFGGDLVVDNACIIATNFGVSQNFIGLTIIAIGTSLPELVTALSALKKKSGTLSAGNILGANIIDLTLILPLCSLISIARGSGELAVSASSVNMDMKICLIVICIAVLPTIITQKFQRWQGILLLLTYGGYIYFVVK